MLSTKPTSRAAEIRAALQSTSTDLDAARAALGTAVVDADEAAAADARAEVARLERQHAEFSAALPIAERRDREAIEAEHERQRRAAEKAANKARAARVAAAKRVDKALADLGRAYRDYLRTDAGGDATSANLLARRQRHAASAALFFAAPEFATVIEPRRRPMRAHYEPLADSVGKTVREFAGVEDDPE